VLGQDRNGVGGFLGAFEAVEEAKERAGGDIVQGMPAADGWQETCSRGNHGRPIQKSV
jgi:hypothetical protein